MRGCKMRAKLGNGLLLVLLVLGLLLPGCSILPLPQDSADRAQTLASDIQLLKEKADEDGKVTVVIKLQGASLAGVEEERVVEELKRQAAQSQRKVLEFLHREDTIVLNTFWLTNAILAEVPVDLLDEFSSLTKVERLFENFTIDIPEPLEEESLPRALQANYAWGLEKIGAPDVWDMGITGSGVRVAVLDTGVDITHPDLAGKMWTDDPEDPTYPGGWIQFDSYGNIVVGSEPYDSAVHGTHVSGTVVGGDASGIAIGVAPGAFLMHGLVIPGGGGTFAQVTAGMEWAIDPFDQYGNPAGEAADVINMSLGGYGYHDAMIEPVQNIKAAGVVLTAAIGNNGEGTSDSPANVYEAFGIGATYIEDLVADFSSGEVVDWPASHNESYIKPDFSAPGVVVYSSVPGGYEHYEGTSMATPHVAGTVALMLEGYPALTVEDIYAALNETAVDLGDEGQDTRYGWGRIDAFEAVSLVTPDSGIEGFVTDAETEAPLEDASISISETGQVRYSDDSGYYRFFLPPGTYNVTASAFGHYQGNATVEVVEDTFTPQDFALEPMPTGFIAGNVTDVETDEPIEGAIITLLDTPLSTNTSGTGEYSVETPVGTYNVTALFWGYRESIASNVTVAENETVIVDFALEPFLAMAAVLGDYESQLTELLLANGIWAEERGWDIINDIVDYDVVVVNRPSDPGEDTFLEFLDAASDNEVGVVFTSSYSVSASYGISLLKWYLGDPAGQTHSYGWGDVYYQVRVAHPIFEGLGDNIPIITGGDCDHAWFSDYSGYTIGDIGSEYGGIRGDAVALNTYGESVHVLLAGLAPQYYTNVPDWTEDAKTIFTRAVLAASEPLELLVSTTNLPSGAVGMEYQATLNAIGGTKPYTWAIIDGALPDELELDGETGVISGTPTETGTFNFTVEVTDAAEATATRELSIRIMVLTEFITDPVGDQVYGYGPDIVGVDFSLDETTIYFMVRTAEPIGFNDTGNYMFLDLDLDASTGYVSTSSDIPTNDIGADAYAYITLCEPVGGELYLWDPYWEYFFYAGDFPISTGTQSFLFAIPLDMLEDDGAMAVVDVIRYKYYYYDDYYYWESTDVAPNEGHGAVGECTLTIDSDTGGSVTTPGEGTFGYSAGTVVKLKVNSDTGYTFDGWTGDVVTIANDGAAVTTITMNGDYSITANFKVGGCFIATAAYGTPMAEEIQILREFRDEYLLTNPVGQALVDFYYRASPPIAEFITENPGLKPIVRAGLVPAMAMSTVAVNTTLAEKAAIAGLVVLVSVALAVWATRRRGRGPEYT